MSPASVHVPEPTQVYLDHVGWFVRRMAPATEVLEALGLVLTPFVAHHHANPAGGLPVAVGTGNRCAMLRRGYLEVLVSIEGVDTPLARQHRAALDRYEGIHLIAFSVADATAARDRLVAEGFEPCEPAHLRRPLSIPGRGHAELEFTVVRVPPGNMAEGRIQVLSHETPEATWHPSLLSDHTPFVDLAGVLLCVDDPVEAAERYGRFLGRAWSGDPDRAAVTLDRGRLDFTTPAEYAGLLPGLALPAEPPVIPTVTLTTTDLDSARRFCLERGIELARSDERMFCIHPSETMGAGIVIHDVDQVWPPTTG